MHESWKQTRTFALLAAALGLGLGVGFQAARAPHTVHAQTHGHADESLDFQLSGIGPTTALTVYNPADRTLYIYPAVTMGSSRVNCSFMLKLTRPGAPIDRQNCQPGTLP